MDFVFLGDSLTEYGDWQEWFSGHSVSNLGRAGETVEGLLRRLRMIGPLPGSPDYLFIMSGINNIAAGDTEFIGAFREAVLLCRSLHPAAAVVIQSVLPVTAEWIDPGTIVAANKRLQQIAGEAEAAYLNLFPRFADGRGQAIADYFDEDGFHLRAAGYAQWVKAIEDHLAATGKGEVSR